MKAIYSVWTPPGNRGTKDGLCHHFRTPQAHMRMLALSMGYSLRWFGRVELWADEWSAAHLAGLVPGVDTITAFEDLDDLPTCLWSMAKISAQAAQGGPYIHIDNDALFVTDPSRLLGHDVVFQSREWASLADYAAVEAEFDAKGIAIPDGFRLRLDDKLYNCGVVMDRAGVLREANAAILGFAKSNASLIIHDQATFLLEQGWQSVAVRDRDAGVLLCDPWNEAESNAAGFVHLLGGWKADPGYEEKVARRLEREFPETAKLIARI